MISRQNHDHRALWLYALIFLFLFSACAQSPTSQDTTPTSAPSEIPTEVASETVKIMPTSTSEPSPTAAAFEMSIPGFKQGEIIPARFACTGENLSPEIQWAGAPEGTQSLTFIFDDPVAPGGTWIHWILFNLPANSSGLAEAMPSLDTYPDGSSGGVNSWGEIGYGGPCPPEGSTHQYIFSLYAIDISLDLQSGSSKKELLEAMEGHVLGEGVYSGLFSR